MARNFLNLCHAQTCGKCVPCRIGLGQLSTLMGKILEGKGKMEDLQVLEETARMALLTRQLDPQAQPAPQYLLDKHYFRKHGANAYYGQR